MTENDARWNLNIEVRLGKAVQLAHIKRDIID